MNTVIRNRLMDWQSARIAMKDNPSYRAAVALQRTYRKHRAAVRTTLNLIQQKEAA